MRRTILILVMVAAAISCSGDEEDGLIVTEPMYSVSVEIPDTISLGEQINYMAQASLLNACEHYSHLAQSAYGHETYVTLYKNRHIGHEYCADEVTTIEAIGAYHPNVVGTYTFNFWRTEGEFLIREVVVR